MKLAYLILAHGNPEHFGRLVSNLLTGHAVVYVHIDRKSDIAPFIAACSAHDTERVHFISTRFSIYWGAYSTVQAILALMQAALAGDGKTALPDYLVLLSGADYPLRKQADIEQFFEDRRGAEFMNRVPIPHEGARKLLNRVESWTPTPGLWSTRILRLAHRIGVRFGLIPARRDVKKGLAGQQPYGGSTWWALTSQCASFVVDYAASHPRVMRFYRNWPCVDETCIQTIVCNSPFADQVTRNVTYTDWSADLASPAELTDSHIDHFMVPLFSSAHDVYGYGELLFARKFSDDSAALTTRLDRLNQSKSGRHS